MTGLIVEMLFMLFYIYNTCNGLKMSEYEVYWLQIFHSLINGHISRKNYGDLFPFNVVQYTLVIKSKQTKINNFLYSSTFTFVNTRNAVS